MVENEYKKEKILEDPLHPRHSQEGQGRITITLVYEREYGRVTKVEIV